MSKAREDFAQDGTGDPCAACHRNLGIDPGYGELGWATVRETPGNRREVVSSGWLKTD